MSPPSDLVAGREFSGDTEVRSLDGVGVPAGWVGLDIGRQMAATKLARTPRPINKTKQQANT